MGFLRKFGYLDENPSNSEALYLESSIGTAIGTMQRFGGLNPTGRIDNDTLQVFTSHRTFAGLDGDDVAFPRQLLVSPRCGNKDVDAEVPSRRRRRFIIGSPGWNKRRITYL